MKTVKKSQQKQSTPRLWQRQIIAGSPVERHGIRITPQSEAISFSWGGPFPARFVYCRPTRLLIEQNETTEYVPVVDATRLAQVGLWALAILFLLIPRLYAPRPK